MPNSILDAVTKAFELAATVDEVYAAAEKACSRCAACSGRCTGYGSCRMFPAMNMKLDAIEVA